jgi:hypothetical protein
MLPAENAGKHDHLFCHAWALSGHLNYHDEIQTYRSSTQDCYALETKGTYMLAINDNHLSP